MLRLGWKTVLKKSVAIEETFQHVWRQMFFFSEHVHCSQQGLSAIMPLPFAQELNFPLRSERLWTKAFLWSLGRAYLSSLKISIDPDYERSSSTSVEAILMCIGWSNLHGEEGRRKTVLVCLDSLSSPRCLQVITAFTSKEKTEASYPK